MDAPEQGNSVGVEIAGSFEIYCNVNPKLTPIFGVMEGDENTLLQAGNWQVGQPQPIDVMSIDIGIGTAKQMKSIQWRTQVYITEIPFVSRCYGVGVQVTLPGSAAITIERVSMFSGFRTLDSQAVLGPYDPLR